MSGIAIAASTIPGSVATFCSCSSERSVRIAASRSASAKTRAGTRMSSRALAGISHSVSSMRTGSDIEHDVPAPAVAVTVQLEVVVRHGLDEVTRLARAPDDDRGHRVLADDEVACLVGDEALGLGEEDELGEPLGQQRAAIGRLGLDLALDALARRRLGVLLEQLAEREHGLPEDRGLAPRVQLELQLGGELDPAVRRLHALSDVAVAAVTAAQTLRVASRGNQVRRRDRVLREALGAQSRRQRRAGAAAADAQGAGGGERLELVRDADERLGADGAQDDELGVELVRDAGDRGGRRVGAEVADAPA